MGKIDKEVAGYDGSPTLVCNIPFSANGALEQHWEKCNLQRIIGRTLNRGGVLQSYVSCMVLSAKTECNGCKASKQGKKKDKEAVVAVGSSF